MEEGVIPLLHFNWRRERDSNPHRPFDPPRFQRGAIPLGDLSGWQTCQSTTISEYHTRVPHPSTTLDSRFNSAITFRFFHRIPHPAALATTLAVSLRRERRVGTP